MENTINVLIGEPYTGETKFHVGDTLKDVMFPSSERFEVITIEVQQLSPFHEGVVYTLRSNRAGECTGLQEIIEHEGRFEVESTDETMRKVWQELFVDRVKNGELKRLM